MSGEATIADYPMDDRAGLADGVSSPNTPCPPTFAVLVELFVADMESFRASLARMGNRDVHPREPPRRDPGAIREPW